MLLLISEAALLLISEAALLLISEAALLLSVEELVSNSAPWVLQRGLGIESREGRR